MSDRKIDANRANAQKSTGPTSPSGKAKAAQNAVKHGLSSREVVLADEDPEAYECLRNQLWDQLRPRNVLEEVVCEITETAWRIQRLVRVEKAVFTRRSVSFTGCECDSGFAFINDAGGLDAFSKLSRYEALLTRKLHRALEQFRKVRAEGIDYTSPCTEPASHVNDSIATEKNPASGEVAPNAVESAQPNTSDCPLDHDSEPILPGDDSHSRVNEPLKSTFVHKSLPEQESCV